MEETNLINVSSSGEGGFYFHNKTTSSSVSKLLMSITSAKNVCIGSSTPTEKLEIKGDVFINNPTSKLYLGVKNNYILGDTSNMAIRTNGDLYIQDTNAVVQKMPIKGDGKICIGTSTPSTTLNVNGDTTLDGGLKMYCQYPSSPFNSYFYGNGLNSNLYGNQFRIYKANETKLAPLNILKDDLLGSIQGQGYDTVSSWYLKSSSVNFRASENYTSSTTNGEYLTFGTNPDNVGGSGVAERLRVTQNGDVGIGITAPTTKLDVVGDIKASCSIISPYFYAPGKENFLAQSLSRGSYWTWNSSNGQSETNFVNVIYSGSFGGFTFSTKIPPSTTSSNLMRIKRDGCIG